MMAFIVELINDGYTYNEIGLLLNVSRQRVLQIYKNYSRGEALGVSREAVRQQGCDGVHRQLLSKGLSHGKI